MVVEWLEWLEWLDGWMLGCVYQRVEEQLGIGPGAGCEERQRGGQAVLVQPLRVAAPGVRQHQRVPAEERAHVDRHHVVEPRSRCCRCLSVGGIIGEGHPAAENTENATGTPDGQLVNNIGERT